MERFEDKRVLVVGLARSGLAAASFLRRRGALVTITDRLLEAELGVAVEQARRLGCSLALGGHPQELFTGADLIVLSPGVPLDLPQLVAARARGVPVTGEFELACRQLSLPMVAVTGTNGKTTTTTLIGDMLKRSGRPVFVGGNIGNPLISLLEEAEMPELAVVEVSSFQLDIMETFHPQVAVLLNITEDHLDRYPSFDAYAASKCLLFARQTEEDVAVLPADDPLIMGRCAPRSRRLLFSRHRTSADAHLNGNRLICRGAGGEIHSYDLGGWQLTGHHNLENLLASVLAAGAAGASPDAVQQSINEFRGLPHRLELIHEWRGIRFYNDSKGTNVDAVVRSLESFTEPIVLIAGGRDKGGSYGPLVPLVRDRVKTLVLMGESRFLMAKALGHLTCTVVVETMGDAVQVAIRAAVPGDVVLLSPACSSFDLYQNYAERGDHFRCLIYELTGDQGRETGGCSGLWTVAETPGGRRS
ncbi:MAG: UDP-N-acetylmuramoyl-L-alanine--D-glutamate ligase [Nitrospirota bacterium]